MDANVAVAEALDSGFSLALVACSIYKKKRIQERKRPEQ